METTKLDGLKGTVAVLQPSVDEALQQSLQSRLSTIRSDISLIWEGRNFLLPPPDVTLEVAPEGIGAIHLPGVLASEGYTVLYDIGRGTANIVVVDAEGPLWNTRKTYNTGVEALLQRLSSAINSEANLDTEALLWAIRDGSFLYKGESFRAFYTEAVDHQRKVGWARELKTQYDAFLRTRGAEIWENIRQMAFIGGGGGLLAPWVEEMAATAKQKKSPIHPFVVDQPETAAVRGYAQDFTFVVDPGNAQIKTAAGDMATVMDSKVARLWRWPNPTTVTTGTVVVDVDGEIWAIGRGAHRLGEAFRTVNGDKAQLALPLTIAGLSQLAIAAKPSEASRRRKAAAA